tara:strand:- start:2222 stop:2815 length:594 start_codon:yes stop_codon:yes gene_type:complete
MGLWGATDADEAKPKYLTTAEKRDVYADAGGWKQAAGTEKSGNDNASAQAETLVAIRGLGTTAAKLNVADISSINWNTTSFDKSNGGTLSVTVNYNEQVTVTGTPQLSVTNGNQGSGSGRGPHVLSYASGTNTNRLTFTLAIAAANAATNADDVLSIGANAVSLNSGTIKEKGTNTDATITSSAGIGTAAGTITVVA